MVKLGNSWDEILKDEFRKDYYLKLREFLKEEYSTRTIYPDMHNIFNALKKASYEDVKVVILGQDPYHEPGQAQGLCFSVPDGFPLPPSLKNIYQGWEIFTDRVIELLNERSDPVVFLLWGGYARKKKALITNPRHYVLEAAHPSPLSAYNGWFGCRHFSRTNGILESLGKAPIDWKGRA